jgi:hypothetical protein
MKAHRLKSVHFSARLGALTHGINPLFQTFTQQYLLAKDALHKWRIFEHKRYITTLTNKKSAEYRNKPPSNSGQSYLNLVFINSVAYRYKQSSSR